MVGTTQYGYADILAMNGLELLAVRHAPTPIFITVIMAVEPDP
jgi:hypothetical protein